MEGQGGEAQGVADLQKVSWKVIFDIYFRFKGN
jgi:hypothetical protein